MILCAALLHDTIEDTETTQEELTAAFGTEIAGVVLEVTDDKTLPKVERKRLQVEYAAHVSTRASLMKMADKTCNLRDIVSCPPDWPEDRKREYFEWVRSVVDQMRDVNPALGMVFDEAYNRSDLTGGS